MLDKSANSLRKLMNMHTFDATKPELFIYKEYHVEAFHDSELKPTYRNIMRKVRNNLTFALNKFPTILPNYVIVVISNNYLHDAAFVEFEMKTILKRVLNDVIRLLASRREQIIVKNRNNLLSTEVFIMRPLPKPAKALKRDYQFKNTRRNFNQMLDRLSRTYNFRPLNIDEINCSDRLLFEDNGDLSEFGLERMWHSISEFIRIRDKQRLAALNKFAAVKEDASTQTEELQSFRNERGPDAGPSWDAPQDDRYDEYRTATANQSRPHRQWGRFDDYHFDEYHRKYDRNDYSEEPYN